jgi:hypothetical protein
MAGMGDWWIFLKNLCETSINKDLSNEHNFGLIHLAGQVPAYVAWRVGTTILLVVPARQATFLAESIPWHSISCFAD